MKISLTNNTTGEIGVLTLEINRNNRQFESAVVHFESKFSENPHFGKANVSGKQNIQSLLSAFKTQDAATVAAKLRDLKLAEPAQLIERVLNTGKTKVSTPPLPIR